MKIGAKKLIAREWTDRKSGKIHWRVRWNDVAGKECVKVFGTPEAADAHIVLIAQLRVLHGRAAAVSQDEVSGLAFWRKFVADELTAGRDAPSLRDALKPAVERLSRGQPTPALGDLQERFMSAKKGKSPTRTRTRSR